MNVSDDSYKTHRNFILEIFRQFMADFEVLNHLYEEKNLHWEMIFMLKSNSC